MHAKVISQKTPISLGPCVERWGSPQMLLMRTKPQCLPVSSLPSLTLLTLTSAPLWLLTSISELWIFSAAPIVPHQGWNLNLILSLTHTQDCILSFHPLSSHESPSCLVLQWLSPWTSHYSGACKEGNCKVEFISPIISPFYPSIFWGKQNRRCWWHRECMIFRLNWRESLFPETLICFISGLISISPLRAFPKSVPELSPFHLVS